jgi:hypothetical protein
VRALSLVIASALCACGGGHVVRTYPRWVTIGGRDLRAGCAIADVFVRKSGKEGIGVTVELRSRFDCDAKLGSLDLVFPDGARATGHLPPQTPLRGRSLVYLWVPIRFHADAAWNHGRTSAALELVLAVGDETRTWEIPVEERWPQRGRDTWESP